MEKNTIQDIPTRTLIEELESRHLRVEPKTEINQRNEHELLFVCNCGSSEHHVVFNWDDYDDFADYRVTVVDPLFFSLWDRIKKAVGYIFKREYLWYAEVGLHSDDLKKIKEHIDAYLESLTKRTKYKVEGSRNGVDKYAKIV